MTFRSACFAMLVALMPLGTAWAKGKPFDEARASMLGDYLSGSYALYLNDPRAQSRFFQTAFERTPEDIRIGRMALYSALFSGDQALARETAQDLYKTDKTESMARAVLAVDAFSKGRSSRVRRYATDPSADFTMNLAMQLLLGWTHVDEGRYEAARQTFQNLSETSYFTALGQLQLAKLEARLGNIASAEAAFDIVESSGIAPLEYNLARARFEAGTDRPDAAIARMEAMIADNPAADIGPAGAYLRRLQDGRRLPKLSIRAQAARALTDPSFAFFVRNRSVDGGETFLRFARWIDPDYDRAAVWLAGLLEENHPEMDPDTRSEITSLYDSIERESSYFVNARLGLANQLFDQERDEDAIAILEELALSDPSYFTREALGRARFFRENWAEALPFYSQLVASLSPEELQANPDPLRMRGIIYERLGRWPEAQTDFLRVLKYKPDDADTLNYLGYTWVDRGENLVRAFELIEKAVELEPDSGAIVDSLGWAHYKLGRYDEAKTHLERAAVLSPWSATIIDHLGDVYWRLGRKREATYQWRRALEFDPTDEEVISIQAKLDAGPLAVPAS
ncbi:MAG: tetratricopeptide repeat protein [Pseudomonadota bacterium]